MKLSIKESYKFDDSMRKAFRFKGDFESLSSFHKNMVSNRHQHLTIPPWTDQCRTLTLDTQVQ